MNGSRLKLWCTSLVLMPVACACSQGSASIGDQGTTPVKTGLAAYVANWVGYAEARQFMDGTDTVRIAIADDGTGTIRFGDREIWPAASDPIAPYPPDIFDAVDDGCPPNSMAWDGFLHPLHNLRVEQERLRAAIASQAVFSSWCSIQHPIAMVSGAYTCLEAPSTWIWEMGAGCDVGLADAGAPTGIIYSWIDQARMSYELAYVSFMQAALCTEHMRTNPPTPILCQCSETGCQLATVADDIILDAALDASQSNMLGTLVVGSENYTIRLKRQ